MAGPFAYLSSLNLPRGSQAEPAAAFRTTFGTSGLWLDESLGRARVVIQAGNVPTFTVDSVGASVLGFTVWHAGNHGPGSGLNADLLDGFSSEYFSDIPSRLGYTPVNRAGDVMTGGLQVGNTVGRVGLVPGNGVAPGYAEFRTLDNTRRGYIGWSDGSNRLLIASENGWSWSFTSTPLVGSNAIWHAGNDGPGTGLDADTVDGLHASSFAPVSHVHPYEPVFSKGNLVAGANVTLSGTLLGRLVGAGDVTITAAGATGVTDHGVLTGLADDDHPQYHTDTRGDARYLRTTANASGILSIASTGALAAGNLQFALVNDTASPGLNRYYGTNAAGVKGWFALPAGGGVTSHGALTGLAADDHLQYHTDARGDARYLRLSGGTLTGGLSGQAASFNGLVTSFVGLSTVAPSASFSDRVAIFDADPTGAGTPRSLKTRTLPQFKLDLALVVGDVSGLTGALNGKLSTSTSLSTLHSITGGGALSSGLSLSLVGDTASPGASRYYGTDAGGSRGWWALPSGGGGTTIANASLVAWVKLSFNSSFVLAVAASSGIVGGSWTSFGSGNYTVRLASQINVGVGAVIMAQGYTGHVYVSPTQQVDGLNGITIEFGGSEPTVPGFGFSNHPPVWVALYA